MGREANCRCNWASESADCKVLLETHELIVRGGIRRRVPIGSLTRIKVDGDQLRFRAGTEDVALGLGANQAERWAKTLSTPPPTLAAKLGITSATRLAILGELDCEELATAVSVAVLEDGRNPTLVMAMVKTAADLNYALDRFASFLENPPIWTVYAKGAGKPLTESEIRSTLRREGFMDTKVASVSAKLTALRFNKR